MKASYMYGFSSSSSHEIVIDTRLGVIKFSLFTVFVVFLCHPATTKTSLLESLWLLECKDEEREAQINLSFLLCCCAFTTGCCFWTCQPEKLTQVLW